MPSSQTMFGAGSFHPTFNQNTPLKPVESKPSEDIKMTNPQPQKDSENPTLFSRDSRSSIDENFASKGPKILENIGVFDEPDVRIDMEPHPNKEIRKSSELKAMGVPGSSKLDFQSTSKESDKIQLKDDSESSSKVRVKRSILKMDSSDVYPTVKDVLQEIVNNNHPQNSFERTYKVKSMEFLNQDMIKDIETKFADSNQSFSVQIVSEDSKMFQQMLKVEGKKKILDIKVNKEIEQPVTDLIKDFIKGCFDNKHPGEF